ncbi:MAG: hydrogenase maturation nickel metallochaperone HypA [Fournierella sp.]|uniref:hydrogenase maturation nickel metallochaperone HypA n=1 Tax=Allofournierella sp. TaxID=1940256 RepID=UPI002A7EF96A|nr:hydrogenase maturation nickel metallochaperone HypA [Fournierella sp.]MDY4166529.1 hydrogenase maturation nickel metallochaperone HypA [Fournierella sp.]
MHELGIVFHIISGVEEVGRKNRVKRVSAVTLQLGEVSGVVEHYLQDCWRWAADRSELLKGAQLRVETIPAQTLCESCGEIYPTVAHGKTCPACGSAYTHLLQGSEMLIKEIEVPEETDIPPEPKGPGETPGPVCGRA